MYEYKAKIISVYDGDTCTALVDLGFNINLKIKIRLFGIDTPELRGEDRDNGIKSRDRLRELILDKNVTIKTYKDRTEKYGRWLASIYIDVPETIIGDIQYSVNDILVKEGLAIPYMDKI